VAADPVVRYDVAESVATIRLNRPEAMNSLTVQTKEALLAAVRTAADDPAVRCVVLTGSGRAFCAGQDLREHAAALATGDPTPLATVRTHYNPITTALVEMPKPVVAAVNGIAAGAGMALACACDLRLAADGARFATAFAGIGLAGDSGISWTLPRLIGQARAAALLLLADPVPAQQALQMGLVNAVVPADGLATAAAELAGRLAAGPTTAYGWIKRELATAATAPLAEALELEAEAQAACGATADHRAATAAFVGKQTPTFSGR
jgi:2-(1,2-epoxy-1,2-dihydrophenyl)acetyl-CoA isomerase